MSAVRVKISERSEHANMKRLLCALLTGLLVISLFSCTNLESTKEEKAAALTICGMDVPYEMLRYTAMNALFDRNLGTSEIADAEKLNRELLDEAVQALCVTYGCFNFAKERGIDPFNEVIDAMVKSTLDENTAGYGSDRELKKALAQSAMNREVLSTLIRYEVVYSEIFEDMIKKGDIVTDEAALRDIFAGDDFIRVKVLCFSTQRHTIEECRALADEAEKALKTGADFTEYTNEHGEMLEMFKNTDGIYVCRGIWREEVEQAAFGLDVGEMSAPIESPDGVRILLREEKEDAYLEANFDSLTDTYEEGVFRITMEECVKAAADTVVLPDGFYDRSVFGMKVG